MNVGVGIQEMNGNHYGFLTGQTDGISVSVYLCSADDYEQAIDSFIDGLYKIKRDFKQLKSGIVLARDIPDGLKNGAVKNAKGNLRP